MLKSIVGVIVLLTIVGLAVAGICYMAYSNKPKDKYNPELKVSDTPIKYNDSIGVSPNSTWIPDSTIKELLLTYYKAGYNDAQNDIIDLYNHNRLTNAEVGDRRMQSFSKMGKTIKSGYVAHDANK